MTAHKEALTAYVTFMEANSSNNPVTKATATVDYATPPDKPVLSLPFVYKDADGNVYDFAFGLNWSGVINDWRTEKYAPKKR